jgi:type IV secretory pathway VirB2 component (pilin)
MAQPGETKSPRGLPNTWLDLSGGLGRFGAAFLIIQHLLLLLAPLFFLANMKAQLPPGRTTLDELLILLTGPEQLVHIADLMALPGIIFLSVALVLALVGLRTERVPVNLVLMVVGAAAAIALVLWVPTTLYSQGRASGAILTLDEIAATGGFTIASALVLVASLLWMAFTLGLQKELHLSPITSYHWPVYAAVTLLGAAAIAAFVQSIAAGAPSQDALLIGIILKATLIPVLGVMAYSNLRERFYVLKQLRFAPRGEEKPTPLGERAPAPPPPPEKSPAPSAEPSRGGASSTGQPRAATSRR